MTSKVPLRRFSAVAVTAALAATVFLVAAAAAPAARCGNGKSSCGTSSPPTAMTSPSISGSPTVGSALSASPGSWSPTYATYAYQWQYCSTDMTSCANITSATSKSYTPDQWDAGGRDRVKVTATDAAGSTVAYSEPTAVITAPATPPAAGASWMGGFDTGDISQWAHPGINSNLGDHLKTSADFAAVSNPLRQGTFSGRFTVHQGDCPFNCPAQERTEVYIDPATTQGIEGRDEWYAWSSYFPNTDATLGNTSNPGLGTTAPFPNSQNMFTQWHGLYPYEANVGLMVNKIPNSSPGYTIQFFANGGSTSSGESGSVHLPIPAGFTGYSGGGLNYIDLASMSTRWNRWLDFRVHIIWSTSSSIGLVEVKMNDGSGWTTVLPASHTATLYSYSGGNQAFMKQGWYRMNNSGSAATSTVYHDGTRVGPTEASVTY